jgi:ubiquinone/menaquinone biosynthesis C-methylase UbiE
MKENQYSNMDYWMNRVYKEGKQTHRNDCVLRSVAPIMKKIRETIPIGKGTKILDVGCGSGNYTYQFSLLSDNVIGIDHSEYIFKKNPHKAISIMDATAMAFADNSFDIVFCSDTLHHIPEYEKAVSEMVRVSKKYVVILEANSLNPMIYGVGITRRQERLLIRKPLTLGKFKGLLKGTKILFAKHVMSFFFPNALARVPGKVLDRFPKVRFVNVPFMPWFFIIAEKKG